MYNDKRSTDRPSLVLLRGGGDLASGVALRLHRAGIRVVIAELKQPLAVRRAVSFAEAVYEGTHTVEGVTARLVQPQQILATLAASQIPVLVDPEANLLLSSLRSAERQPNRPGSGFQFSILIDARLLKIPPAPLPTNVSLHIGLGPGFRAGVNCHAAIETRRSHTLGRVYWEGPTQPDSGQPEGDPRRVLRAPQDGALTARTKIGEHVQEGQVIATVGEQPVFSPLSGVLRGLIREGLPVTKGVKIGDVDPRDDPAACFLVSDKALAIGGAALEAILSREDIRGQLWE